MIHESPWISNFLPLKDIKFSKIIHIAMKKYFQP